jgi:hypothetical protein
MKKTLSTIAFVLGTIFSNCHAQPTNSIQQYAAQTFQNFDGNDLVACINLLQLTMAHHNEMYPDQDQETSLEWSSWAKSFVDVYLHSLLVTISHELGHAIAAKILSHTPINIHIGSYEPSSHALIQTTSFALESLNPYIGYAHVNQTNSTSKEVLILLAGGTSGLITHFILKALKMFFRKYKNRPKFSAQVKIKKSIKDSLTKISTLDIIAGLQFANILIPMGRSSDATKLWRIAGVPEHVVDSLGQVGPFIAGLLVTIFIQGARHYQKQNELATLFSTFPATA